MILLVLLRAVQFMYGQQYRWESAIPEDEGFSSEKLVELRDTLALKQTTSILIIKNGRIILEWYASGWDQNRKHYTASLSKALVGGISLMLALDRRK